VKRSKDIISPPRHEDTKKTEKRFGFTSFSNASLTKLLVPSCLGGKNSDFVAGSNKKISTIL
jgi:hypothetical protein